MRPPTVTTCSNARTGPAAGSRKVYSQTAPDDRGSASIRMRLYAGSAAARSFSTSAATRFGVPGFQALIRGAGEGGTGGRAAGDKRIRIEALPRSPDAVWEYTFRDPAAGPVRGLEQVVALDDATYLIEWRAPKAAWAAHLPNLAVVLDSFRPLRGA